MINNHFDDFVLYGKDWNLIKKEFSEQNQILFQKQYKGKTPQKIETASQAKFMFAFENARHSGYISEKIFDAMKAGTIPIYFGAPNITEYVPTTCFIDYTQFSTPEELYLYLKNMPESTYLEYKKNIRQFIQNFEKTPFYYKTVANLLIKTLFPREHSSLFRR